MTEPHRPRVKYVIGPDGSPLTIADLPAPGTKRWVIRRKAEVVAAVRGGLLSLEEACSRYTLTVEEFLSWQYSIDQHGLAGLRTTRIQQYRQCALGPGWLPGCYLNRMVIINGAIFVHAHGRFRRVRRRQRDDRGARCP